MRNSKLVQSLTGISVRELKSFEEFVYSPYFNKHEKSRQLCKLLINILHNDDLNSLNREFLFKKLFPKQAYNLQRLKDLFSQLMELFELFIQVEEMDNRKIESRINGLEYCYNARLTKAYKSNFNRLEKQIESSGQRDSQYHFWKYRFHSIEDEYLMSQEDRTLVRGLQSKVDHLDVFYLSMKLKESCNMINRMNVHQSDYTIRNLDEILGIIRSDWEYFSSFPSIEVYYSTFLTLSEPEIESYFEEFIKLLKSKIHYFSPGDARELFTYARNYCTKKINTGGEIYLKKLSDIYREMIKNGLIYEKNMISEWSLKNIITVEGRLKHFRWAEEFLAAHENRISSLNEQNAYWYNLASLFYWKGDYGKVMELLQKVEFVDVYYQLGARSMLLRSYYEMNEIETLLSLVHSFEVYLLRSKHVSPYQKKSHQHFIRLTKRMALLCDKMETLPKKERISEKERLIKSIQRSKFATNSTWLLEKAEEI